MKLFSDWIEVSGSGRLAALDRVGMVLLIATALNAGFVIYVLFSAIGWMEWIGGINANQ